MSTVLNNEIETVAHPSNFEQHFTIVQNQIVDHPTLSPYATTLIIYLISKPKGWKFHDSVLLKRLQCGVSRLKSCWKELRDAGYVRTVSLRNDNGDFRGSRREFSKTPIFLNKNNELMESMDNGLSIPWTGPETIPSINNTDLITNTYLDNNNIIDCVDSFESEKKQKITKNEAEKVFGQVWSQYPRKEGRKGALETFLKKTVGKTPEEFKNLTIEIMEGMVAYVTQMELYRKVKLDNPHFYVKCPDYKHGSTFFGKESWTDTFMTSYEQVFEYVSNRPENIGRKPSRAEQFSKVLSQSSYVSH